MQISSILLKLKGYDEKLGDLSKIGNNENNISSVENMAFFQILIMNKTQ